MTMDNGNGEGRAGVGYVSRAECEARNKNISDDVRDIKRALWGGEGTTGIVADIRTIKTERKFGERVTNFIIGILGALITIFLSKILGI